jgi:ParB-like chromosome segregation protein Spo0J
MKGRRQRALSAAEGERRQTNENQARVANFKKAIEEQPDTFARVAAGMMPRLHTLTEASALVGKPIGGPPGAEPPVDSELLKSVRQEVAERGFPRPAPRAGWTAVSQLDIVDDLVVADQADPADEDAIQIRGCLDPATVLKYALSLRELPPIDVFLVAQPATLGQPISTARHVLADGFHRVAAARLLCLDALPAYVRKGSWQEAQQHAVTANVRHGVPLSRDDRNAGIARLRRLGVEEAEIGRRMGLSESAVSLILSVASVRDAVRLASLDRSSQRSAARERRALDHLSDRKVREIARADEGHWGRLAGAAHEQGWSSDEIRTAVATLADPVLREGVLAGTATPDGTAIEPRAHGPGRRSSELFRALSALKPLAGSDAAELLLDVNGEELRQLVADITICLRFLTSLRHAAEEREGQLQRAVPPAGKVRRLSGAAARPGLRDGTSG